jgi:hypothetical protein
MSEILKKVFVNDDGHRIITSTDLHKKIDSFSHIQKEPSQEWKIKHDLNTTGIVGQVWDNEGIVVIPEEIVIENSYEVTIVFSKKQSGKIILIGNKLL